MDSVLNFPKEPYMTPQSSIKTHLHIMVMISKVQVNRDHSKYLLPEYKSIIMHTYLFIYKIFMTIILHIQVSSIGIGMMLASSDKYQLPHSMLNEVQQKQCHSYRLLIKHLYFYSLKEQKWKSINLNSGYVS
ncbi:hypothetical protein AMTRI_Chr01g137590 [Amborella trichopoda]